ncbi:MAG: sulfatase [Bacteroidota bacterium]
MNKYFLGFSALIAASCQSEKDKLTNTRPNILIAISDDQSWPHAGAYGTEFVKTPAFDKVAKEGILFHNAIAPSPGCAPSRSALVTGRYAWQNEHAGQHFSVWPRKYKTMSDVLKEAGYHVGYTGKGVAPFFHVLGGRYENPAGPEYNSEELQPPTPAISNIDYTGNFKKFLEDREPGQPFYFWYGSQEPHRRFAPFSGRGAGKEITDNEIPGFLPEFDSIRDDLLDYALEIEWFDEHLGRILGILEETGELDNTIIFVTSDNGMAFPAAKANCYEFGIHVPLAVRWGKHVKPGREVDDVVSLVDFFPTVLEISGLSEPEDMPVSGQSILDILLLKKSGSIYDETRHVYASRERHSSSRWQNLGYPQRAVRTNKFLYIRNFKPERWPAGYPFHLSGDDTITGYTDIDGTVGGLGPRYFVENLHEPGMEEMARHAVGKRPPDELYDIQIDPACMVNLSGIVSYETVRNNLHAQLMMFLSQTSDPRVTGDDPDVFETYPRYAGNREFPMPEWAYYMNQTVLDSLIAGVGTDESPAVRPDSIAEWGLKAGDYKLVMEDNWQLYLIEEHGMKNVTNQRSNLTGQFIKLYHYFKEKE